MSIAAYSTDPALNRSVGAHSIAEGGSAGDVDDALRQLLADLAVYRDTTGAQLTAASDALALGTVSALVGTRVYATQALLYADLVPTDGQFALVYADPTPSKNDLYRKTGATGAGSWSAPLQIFAASNAAASATAASVSAAAAAVAETAAQVAAANAAASATTAGVSAATAQSSATSAASTLSALISALASSGVSPSTITLPAASRAILAAITGQSAGTSAILSESGREGVFVFRSTNLSTQVTTDPVQGVYVAPAADTTGASGAWVRQSDGVIDARWFGVAEGIDSGAALNAFFAFAAAHDDLRVLRLSGSLTTSIPIVYDNLLLEDVPRLILWGGMKLTATAAMSVLLTIKNAYRFSFIGTPTLVGTGDHTYASRTVGIGLWIELSPRCTFSGVNAQFFQHTGVYFPPTNSNIMDFGNVSVQDSGSGQGLGSGDATEDLTAVWSAPVNSGSSLSSGQRTTLNVTATPPVANDAYLRPTFVDIGGEIFQVMTIDRAAGTIAVHPWVPAAAVPGTLHYIFGGAFSIGGGDNAVLRGSVDARSCGVACFTGALYSPQITRLVAQNCGIGLAMGDTPTDAHTGGRIGGLYCENNKYDINRVTSSAVNISINSEYALNITKVVGSGYSRDAAGAFLTNTLLDTIEIFKAGYRYSAQKSVKGNAAELGSKLSGFTPTLPRGSNAVFRKDSWNFELAAFDDDVNRLWGIDSTMLAMVGTGASGQPSGNYVFKPKLGDAINALPAEAVGDYTTAGAWATFTMKGPTIFLIYRLVATKTWYIWPVGGTIKGAAVADPAALTYVAPTGGATIDTQARASLVQLAADVTSIRTQLIAALASVRNAGVTS